MPCPGWVKGVQRSEQSLCAPTSLGRGSSSSVGDWIALQVPEIKTTTARRRCLSLLAEFSGAPPHSWISYPQLLTPPVNQNEGQATRVTIALRRSTEIEKRAEP